MPPHFRSVHEEAARATGIQKERNVGAILGCCGMLHRTIPLFTSGKALSAHTLSYSEYSQGGNTPRATQHSLSGCHSRQAVVLDGTLR